VIYGRDEQLRISMFDFLRALHLRPLEWSKLALMEGTGSPYIGNILEKGLQNAQAVVALLSPDDYAYLREDLRHPHDPGHEKGGGQARPNVLFEAGMAFGYTRHMMGTAII
jgi:predicted nucleotide-binding protein